MGPDTPTSDQDFKGVFVESIGEILASLENMDKLYGERARLAQENEGIDWKAISHAYRCCQQLRELAQTGEIKFPLFCADFLKRIKKGKIPYSLIQQELPELMESATDMVKFSTFLPDEPDYNFWERFVLAVYK